MFSRRRVLSVGTAAAIAGTIRRDARAEDRPAEPASNAPISVEADQIRQTLAIGALTLLASRRAEERLTIPKLKRFAQLEIAEQETVLGVLQSLPDAPGGKEGTDKRTAAAPEDLLVPAGRQILNKLRDEMSTNLEREYFILQGQAHQQLLQIQEEYLKVGKSTDHINIVKLIDVQIREHLQLLIDIRNEMFAGLGPLPPGR